ncbi:MAG TPA: glycoside hydrolase family 3 N-terminal domain-containing protein [Candidatus Hydrogenedentes bacterium]|nr:glycoside hydrolase family 3 N-terminal domain-containing protein [Candidatus Hydrogenedentota bacterium]HOL76568.1 glycoside hydrolase family 3 N-terminal domain-containing protein [Candidatus Hydrogenedentota bacterium]HPO85231.1 glycoside hydrolase family 3 N-terminal domain-containing protein [Candidatus Hydrogenedentota bacterium]
MNKSKTLTQKNANVTFVALLFLLGIVIFPCVLGNAYGESSGLSSVVDKSHVVSPETPPPQPAEKVETAPPSATLTLREKVAQLMIVTLQGDPLPDSQDLLFLSQYPPGGIVLPRLSQPRMTARYVATLRGIKNPSRVWIAANMHTFPKYNWGPENYFPPIPSLLSVAASNDNSAANALGIVIAELMNTLGLDVHLGPTLELAPTLPESKGNIQCLGSVPQFAADAGCALIATLSSHGILPVPLGFPGGGYNKTPKQPAVLSTPRPLLEEHDLLPYRKAIEQGVAIIHVSNTLVPTIDPANVPASLSRPVMVDLLRNQLGFQGVVIAGPMDDEDITRYRDASAAARAALEAGADMILWNSAGQRVMKTIDQIVMAIQRGELDQDIVESALRRVQQVKQDHTRAATDLPKATQAEKIEKTSKYSDAAYKIERKSITLVQNRNNALPLQKTKAITVGICGVIGVSELQSALERYLKKVPVQPITTAKHGGDIYDFEIDRVTRGIQGAGTIICILTSDIRPAGQTRLINAIKMKGPRVVVVLVGYPSSLPQLQTADAIVLAYCNPDALEESMRAVADVLMGEGAPGIFQPVRELHFQLGVPQKLNALDVIRVPSGRLPVNLEPPFVAGLVVQYDPSKAVKKVEWDFGDKERMKGVEVEKVYNAPGSYIITLTLIDSKNDTVQQTFPAIVE